MYAYTVALLLKNKEATLAFSQQANARFEEPEKKMEVARTASNAYSDAIAFFKEFEKRNFQMWYQHMDGIKRPMKNETIIQQLDISAEEMKEMVTLIDGVEKQARDTERTREKRREQGVKSREEYIEQEQEKTEDKLWQLQKAMERHPKAKGKELAEMLGVTPARISQLKNMLKKN